MTRRLLALFVLVAAATPASAQCDYVRLFPSTPGPVDRFGAAAAASGSTLLVGAPDAHTGAGAQAGAAYVFEKVGAQWVETAKLIASDAYAFQRFGDQVALLGDTALVSDRPFAAYVFEKQVTGWVEVAKLVPSGVGDNDFGASVALVDGRAVVGMPGDDGVCSGQRNCSSGSVRVFEKAAGWAEVAILEANNPGVGDLLGLSVAASGNLVVAGAPSGNGFPGSVHVFELQGSTWVEQAVLTNPDGVNPDRFGLPVAVDGDTIAAANGTRLHVFDRQGPSWVRTASLPNVLVGDGDEFFALALLDGAMYAGIPAIDGGGALLFERFGTTWVETSRFEAFGNEAVALGGAAAISRESIFIGVPTAATYAGPDAGTVVVAPRTSCDLGVSFCQGSACPCGNDDPGAGCKSSTGSGAHMRQGGSTSVSADDLLLSARPCPVGNTAVFLAGRSVAPAPMTAGDGLLCIGAGAFVYPAQVVDAAGAVLLTNAASQAPPGFIQPGDRVHFQVFVRDVLCGPPPAPCASPCGAQSNLSDAYSVVFSP